MTRAVQAAADRDGVAAWQATVMALWRNARFREERYAALALTGHRTYDPYQTLDALPLYKELIVSGAWWDYVDLGWALRQYAWTDPREVRRYVRATRERLSGLSVREALKNIGH